MSRTYLDYNATAPLRPESKVAMERALDQTGNPSSVHAEGRRARAMIEAARGQVAALIGAEPDRVVFTSGGSEANMTALTPANGGARDADIEQFDCFVSAIEHPSVLAGGRFGGGQVARIGVDAAGLVDCAELSRRLEGAEVPPIVSVMAANNETGVLQPLGEIAEIVHAHDGVLHSDFVQAAGRVALDMGALGVDLASLSAHKIGGPHGVGALILSERVPELDAPLIAGGGQERRRRAGTENVAAIVGFGVAAERALADLQGIESLKGLRDRLEREIRAIAPGAVIFAQDVARLPNTTCFAVEGMSAETLVIAFDLAGVALSAGAACSSGKVERSHVLAAMDVPENLARAALRVSLGHDSGEADVARFGAAWRDIYEGFKARRQAA